MIDNLKTVFKFIFLHKWNKIPKEGVELLETHWKNKPKKGIKKIIYKIILKLND